MKHLNSGRRLLEEMDQHLLMILKLQEKEKEQFIEYLRYIKSKTAELKNSEGRIQSKSTQRG